MTEQTIYSAVAKAMGEIKRIAKDNRNAEQKYDFASVDDFMAMVGPICAANGLVTIIDEDQREFIEKPGKYGVTHWVSIAYQITTYHASGTHLPTVRRNVEVIRSGPQAYGAAQSYILKQYYRGLLNIPTGDKDDPDHGTVEEHVTPLAAKPVAKPAEPPTEAIETARSSLFNADSLDVLKAIFVGLPASVRSLQAVIDAKDARKAELETAPADNADLGGDFIPH
jgi:hypothetical protein